MLTSDHIQLIYPVQHLQEVKIGIIHTQWNARLVDMMYHDAISTFKQYGIQENNIISIQVPGAMEIGYAARFLIEKKRPINGVLTLGAVIRGATPHFDYVCMSVTNAITQLNLTYSIPLIFGIITVNDYQQALERSGIKGKEYAISLLNMIGLTQTLN